MATILPAPEIQFLDQNGNPLAGGTIGTYIPSTLTAKDTWQDSGQTILNTNPIVLDAAGRAIVYGSGVYRFVVRDASGNLVYDQLTADTATGGIANGGVSTGTPNAQVIAASSFSQQDGQAIEFIAGFSNTGPLTIAPGGGSAIPVLTDTSAGPVPMSGGEVVADNAVLLLYEASRGAFHIVNPTPGSFTGATITNATITNSTIATTQIDLDQATDPTPTAEGRIQWSTLFDNIKIGAGGSTKRFLPGAAPGAITGCTIANNGSDAANDIDFASGTCADSTAAFYMTLGSTLTKRLDATWAVGNNQGGLFSGSIANTTYHCFIIMRPDTGVVDCGFDTSPVAANRPASYTYFRRVGSIVRIATGPTIKAFIQTADYFYWLAPPQDVATTGSTSSAVTATLTVPTGIVVVAKVVSSVSDGTTTGNQYLYVSSLNQTDTAASVTNFTLAWASAASAQQRPSTVIDVATNTSAQIRYRSSTSSGSPVYYINTIGWTDARVS